MPIGFLKKIASKKHIPLERVEEKENQADTIAEKSNPENKYALRNYLLKKLTHYRGKK